MFKTKCAETGRRTCSNQSWAYCADTGFIISGDGLCIDHRWLNDRISRLESGQIWKSDEIGDWFGTVRINGTPPLTDDGRVVCSSTGINAIVNHLIPVEIFFDLFTIVNES